MIGWRLFILDIAATDRRRRIPIAAAVANSRFRAMEQLGTRARCTKHDRLGGFYEFADRRLSGTVRQLDIGCVTERYSVISLYPALLASKHKNDITCALIRQIMCSDDIQRFKDSSSGR